MPLYTATQADFPLGYVLHEKAEAATAAASSIERNAHRIYSLYTTQSTVFGSELLSGGPFSVRSDRKTD
jgi:hypothetical protein